MDPTQLLKALVQFFSEEEIRTVSFNLNIDYENLSGSTKEAKARSLIQYCQRRSQLNRLIQEIRSSRPGLNVDSSKKTNLPVDDSSLQQKAPPSQESKGTTVAVITGIFAIAVALIGILPNLIESKGNTSTPVANIITASLTSTMLPSPSQTVLAIATSTIILSASPIPQSSSTAILATATPELQPIDTTMPTTAPTPQPIIIDTSTSESTALPIATDDPCVVQVTYTEGDVLTVVRPVLSSAESLKAINAGTIVKIAERSILKGVSWDRVTDLRGRNIGWIEENYLVNANQCIP